MRVYLTRFNAIFGLNQDLLLELQYEDHVLTASNTRWGGMQKPGMAPVHDPSLTGIGDRHRRRWKPAAPAFTVDARLQPYFKLHGSSNWYTDDGRNLLVMGGNKDFMIREHQVLSWYYDQFRSYLLRPDTRLMVIGYSFSDQHINDVIVEAWRNGSLRGIFLVDPAGRAILEPNSPLAGRNSQRSGRHTKLGRIDAAFEPDIRRRRLFSSGVCALLSDISFWTGCRTKTLCPTARALPGGIAARRAPIDRQSARKAAPFPEYI